MLDVWHKAVQLQNASVVFSSPCID